MVVQVGNIYINHATLRGVTDVARVPPPSPKTKASYTFRIFLEGSTASVNAPTKAEIMKLYRPVVKQISPQYSISTGGVTFAATGVNVIGPVCEDPIPGDKYEAEFTVQMDGVSFVLSYVDYAAANEARDALVEAINKS